MYLPDIHAVINLREKAHWMNEKRIEVVGGEIKPVYKGKIENVNYNIARLIFTALSLNGIRKSYWCPECSSERNRPVYHYESNAFDEWRDKLSAAKKEALQQFYDLVKY